MGEGVAEGFGKLYVVATPIGNLADFSFRAVDTLRQVGLIAAEDTRHVKQLLQHYGISNKTLALHQYNEEKASMQVLDFLRQGVSVALVSDAGTPLFSDPGMPLVKMAKDAGLAVVPIPGLVRWWRPCRRRGCRSAISVLTVFRQGHRWRARRFLRSGRCCH